MKKVLLGIFVLGMLAGCASTPTKKATPQNNKPETLAQQVQRLVKLADSEHK